MDQTYKNILIKTSTNNIEQFKKAGFELYRDQNKIHLFSYKSCLIVILLQMQQDFIDRYKTIHTPSEEYVYFYKKRGTNIYASKKDVPRGSINFSLEEKYYNLYYALMHTFYINNNSKYSNYSSSMFFEEIIYYIQNIPINIAEVLQTENSM